MNIYYLPNQISFQVMYWKSTEQVLNDITSFVAVALKPKRIIKFVTGRYTLSPSETKRIHEIII